MNLEFENERSSEKKKIKCFGELILTINWKKKLKKIETKIR